MYTRIYLRLYNNIIINVKYHVMRVLCPPCATRSARSETQHFFGTFFTLPATYLNNNENDVIYFYKQFPGSENDRK